MIRGKSFLSFPVSQNVQGHRLAFVRFVFCFNLGLIKAVGSIIKWTPKYPKKLWPVAFFILSPPNRFFCDDTGKAVNKQWAQAWCMDLLCFNLSLFVYCYGWKPGSSWAGQISYHWDSLCLGYFFVAVNRHDQDNLEGDFIRACISRGWVNSWPSLVGSMAVSRQAEHCSSSWELTSDLQGWGRERISSL